MRCVVLMLCLFGLGCAGSSPSKIEVKPERRLITKKGGTLQLMVTLKDSKGKQMSTPVTYKSLTPTMATVDGSGVVSGVTSGSATILITASKLTREVDVLVQIAKKIKITPSSPMMMLGVTRGFKATVIDDRDKPMIAGEITWSSSDPTIFTVDKHGNVKTIKEGEARLVADAAGIKDSTTIIVKHEEINEDGTLSQ